MTFQITALPHAPFAPLFALDDAALAGRLARRVLADHQPGFPCRVSLVDAAPGETLILVHWQHQTAATPYRASHAIYIRADAVEARIAPGDVPALFRHRTLSLRGFDATGMLRSARLAEGTALEAALTDLLAAPGVAYAHLHYAATGCYAARADPA